MSLRVAILTLACLLAASANAQPGDRETEQARALFGEGLELADQGEWDRAVQRFRHALELRESAPVRYNLATSLAHMGRLVEALTELDALLDHAPPDSAVREQATRLRDELRPRLGALEVRIEGGTEGLTVTVDGRPWDLAAGSSPADPGVRVVRLLAGERELDLEEADVPEGGSAAVVLEAPLGHVVAPPRVAITDEPPAESDMTWAVFTGIGVGLTLVGGIVLTVVLATQPSSPEGDFDPPVVVVVP